MCVCVCLLTCCVCVLQHQQQVAQAVERAKQVTMTELNAIIGVRGLPNLPLTVCIPPFLLPTLAQKVRGQTARGGGGTGVSSFYSCCSAKASSSAGAQQIGGRERWNLSESEYT